MMSSDIVVAQVPVLPQQDNHCDCGLFLLTYLNYFAYQPPAQLNCNQLVLLKGTSSSSSRACAGSM